MSEFKVLGHKDDMEVLYEPPMPKTKKASLFDELSKIQVLLAQLVDKEDPEHPEPVIKVDAPIVNVEIPEFVKIDEEQVKRLSEQPQIVVGSSRPTQSLNELKQVINPATEEKQDSILTKLNTVGIQASDSASIDAFSRWRTSNPVTLFDAQLTYGLAPLVYEPITAEANATVTHDATNRTALCTFASTPTGGKAYMQTYDYFRYQPGKSQLVFVTFNMKGGVANTLKFAGYSDGVNGIEFQMNGTQPRVALLSDTGNGDEFVNQADWSLDPMDGTGRSGITMDFSKMQIFVIDFQALYVGRVRVGFDIGGSLYYVHEFVHANLDEVPYIQTANLPVRCGMTCTSTVSTTMNFICTSVISEGGQDDITGYSFSQEGTVTAGSGTDTHILFIQPKTTFNSIANRSKFVLESLDIVVTGNAPVKWKLVIGQALSGTTAMNDANTAYSAMEYNILGTLDSVPAIVIAQGYVAASAQAKQSTSTRVPFKYPITLDAAGAARVNGRLSVIVHGIGGTSATRCVLNWKEIR